MKDDGDEGVDFEARFRLTTRSGWKHETPPRQFRFGAGKDFHRNVYILSLPVPLPESRHVLWLQAELARVDQSEVVAFQEYPVLIDAKWADAAPA